MGQQLSLYDQQAQEGLALHGGRCRVIEAPPKNGLVPVAMAPSSAGEAPAVREYYEDLLRRAAAETANTMRPASEAPAMRVPESVQLVALSQDCGFCGALEGQPCVWSARQWPAAWVHSARLAGLAKDQRTKAECDGWVAVLLEILEERAIPFAGQQSDLWPTYPALDTNRGGYRLALEQLKKRGLVEVVGQKIQRVRR